MITISNHTGKVVNIYNDCYSVQLCEDETVEISEDSLAGDFELHFYFPDLKDVQRKIEKDWEKGGVRKKYYYKHQIQYRFPVATVLNVQNLSQVTLKEEEVSLRYLSLFKTVHINKITCNYTSSEYEKPQFMFLEEEHKRQFLKLMRLSNAFSFPAALLAILALVVELFTDDTFMEKATVSVFLLGFIIVALDDFYYTLKARKWGSDMK